MSVIEQYASAFKGIAAYSILKDGQQVATVAFKGDARLQVYLHWIGLDVVRAAASGGGYNRHKAAVQKAAQAAIKAYDPQKDPNAENVFARAAFFRILSEGSDGQDWISALTGAGFDVNKVV